MSLVTEKNKSNVLILHLQYIFVDIVAACAKNVISNTASNHNRNE